ncbi:MAG: hypothetical protein ACOZNI_15360 [Myxococcota bacterium]
MLLLLAGCQDYSLNGPEAQQGKYNPPDLDAEVQVDRITQVTRPSVDVLWVIDNSCSMEEEQVELRGNFIEFMAYFADSGLDYHVGVISTDMEAGDQRGQLVLDDSQEADLPARYIDTTYHPDDAVSSFRQRAALGTDGADDERGKDAVYAALTTYADTTNAGFYRDDAALDVILISDEVDHSNVGTGSFVAWLEGLKPDPAFVSFSSIVGLSDDDCDTAARGTGYLEVTDAVGGIAWSICTDDWPGLLAELGQEAAGLKHEFFLSRVPVEATIEVKVDGEAYGAGDWTYSRTRNSVTFLDYTPEPLSVVEIRYEVLASALDPTASE